MRKPHSALFALCLTLVIVPEIAAAGGAFVVVPGFRGLAIRAAYGYARLYGHPFDDGYDYPFGYGEYAEYGPWAYRNDAPAMRCVGSGPAGDGGKERSGSAIKRRMRFGAITPAGGSRLEVKRPCEAVQKQPRPADHGYGNGKQVCEPGNARSHDIISRQAGRHRPTLVVPPGSGRRPGAISRLLHNGRSANSGSAFPGYFLVCPSAGDSRNTPRFMQSIWPNTTTQNQP